MTTPASSVTPAARQVLAVVEARKLAVSGAGQMIRRAAGLSLAEVADAVGVDPSTLFRWESGERRPSGERAVAYVNFMAELRRVYAKPRRGAAA